VVSIGSTTIRYKLVSSANSFNGRWEKHIDMITGKAYKKINILRKFKFILDRKILEKIDFTFVRPLLKYADVIWVKSSFRESVVSFGSTTIRYKLVSSANSFIVDCISVTMSFIKIIF
jgi:hypothetical protein